MVAPVRRLAPELPAPVTERHGTTVHLLEVLDAGGRIDAAAYGIEQRNAVDAVEKSPRGTCSLYGSGGLAIEAHNAFRFKRIYVRPAHGVPFLSSSDIIALRPEADNYLSRTKTNRLDELLVRLGDVLISRSGTVGNVALAGRWMVGQAVSEDVIRVRFEDPQVAGFLVGFLRSRYGRPQLTGAAYGSVITHIELVHLERVRVPNLSAATVERLGAAMLLATAWRDEANDCLDEADQLLHERLALSPLPTETIESETHTVRAVELAGRFEASYHAPRATTAEDALEALHCEVTTVGDPRVSAEVRAITRFRKRVYVEKGGVPMLNSKQLFQIDPINRKALAKGAHRPGVLKEIRLKAGMLMVTCSGTIGRVQIIPAYMDGWTASQDANRITAAKGMDEGYLYAWLASDYGQALLRRQTYGSVIQHIDLEQLASVPFPLPSAEVRSEVGALVLRANTLRDEAWTTEQAAIAEIEHLIDFAET